MLSRRHTFARLLHTALLCLLLPLASVFAQQPTPTPESQPDDVLRINTDLVQTDVMVFDKSGRFVDNLQREQFELRVDGKPQPISFFDRITAGSASEEAQLAAARGTPRPTEEKNPAGVGLLDRGRIVVFFVDDLHLAFDSLRRTQKTLLHFINDEMGQNDQVAIASVSGQIGFLQQLTSNKTVLRAAVGRLKLQPQQISDPEHPPMSEYLALAIIVRNDRGVLDYFTQPLIQQMIPPTVAEQLVRTRASRILQQSHTTTRSTFFSLESLARTVAPLPGRKLVFFISDGFLLNQNETDIYEKLSNITNVAARNSVVIYTMDARGLSISQAFSASEAGPADPTGRIISAMLGENSASQDALRVLAASTGGRALLNTNALDTAITKTLRETSTYYIIAWRPESEGQKGGKLRQIEVSIKGRKDLTVQVKRGFLTPAKEREAKSAIAAQPKSGKAKTPREELQTAINSFYPVSELPTTLALDYLDSPQVGGLLTISMEVPVEALSFDTSTGKPKSSLDVEGFVYNEQGKIGASFQQQLNITADSLEAARQQRRGVYHTSQVRVGPGLYQVRVAARDAQSGRTGSAVQWIEIPDLKSRKLAMSTLLVGELTEANASANDDKQAAIPPAQLNVSRRFAHTSRLRFLTFIYNAARVASAAPDVAIQVQVMRDDQPILTTTLRKVTTEGLDDFARLPYAAEIPLDKMPAGRYMLQITTIDRIAKTSASQQLRFQIE